MYRRTAAHEARKTAKHTKLSFVQKASVDLRERRVFVRGAAGIVCVLLALVIGRGASAEVIDRVLAVVAGNLITLSDVNAANDLGLVAPRPSVDPIRDVLSRLIDRELQIAEVERFAPPEPSVADVDREVQQLQSRFATRDAFDAVLARTGIDLAHVRETLRENLRIKAYLDERFTVSGDRRQQVIDDWIASLRRRTDIVDLYLTGR